MWVKWKNMLINCIDKHAPLRSKRVGKKKSPWITSQLKQKMRKRDFLKKKAKRTDDPLIWQQYKHSHEIARIMKLKVQKVNILRLFLFIC